MNKATTAIMKPTIDPEPTETPDPVLLTVEEELAVTAGDAAEAPAGTDSDARALLAVAAPEITDDAEAPEALAIEDEFPELSLSLTAGHVRL